MTARSCVAGRAKNFWRSTFFSQPASSTMRSGYSHSEWRITMDVAAMPTGTLYAPFGLRAACSSRSKLWFQGDTMNRASS